LFAAGVHAKVARELSKESSFPSNARDPHAGSGELQTEEACLGFTG
jgi:hypothetical protein